MLFRGLKMTAGEADGFTEGKTVHLTGYTSTSMGFGTALKFALD